VSTRLSLGECVHVVGRMLRGERVRGKKVGRSMRGGKDKEDTVAVSEDDG
jgi:hypothetical protein